MNKNKNQVVKTLFLISQISITMLTTVFICLGLGILVDKVFGTSILWIFIVLGVLAGVNSVSILIKRFIAYDLDNTSGKQYTPDKEVYEFARNKKKSGRTEK